MSISIRKILLMAVFIGLAAGVWQEADAQTRRARERIEMLKKMKMLDVLNLDEKTAEQFIIKYNASENKVEKLREQLHSAMKDLRYALHQDQHDAEIKKLTDKLLELNKKTDHAVQEKAENIRKILSVNEFARYVLFEVRFHKELREMLFRHRRENMMERRENMMGPPDDMGPGRDRPGHPDRGR